MITKLKDSLRFKYSSVVSLDIAIELSG